MAEENTEGLVLNELLGAYGSASEDLSHETPQDDHEGVSGKTNGVEQREAEPSAALETSAGGVRLEEQRDTEEPAAGTLNGHSLDDMDEYEYLVSRFPILGDEEEKNEIPTPVDERIQKKVDLWISVRNDKGFSIVDELRSRTLFKSPDLMMIMMDKFNIEEGGTFLKAASGSEGDIHLEEMRRLGAVHARDVARMQQESREQQKGRKIEFRKGAVSAAVAAAQAKAAAYSQGARGRK
ncbi:hypothetical protein PSENEW3n2_00002111 [Picochlorum sp. SENEW3]|nr:hypothetical protein PSENEW3n2_00002111 [Picochlorum sp. SENEW3]WPT14881.1 hypothetical protein PSENEW3_00002111 [Picochlorum sp. SENEW3]